MTTPKKIFSFSIFEQTPCAVYADN